MGKYQIHTKIPTKKNMTESAMYFTDFYCRQFKRAIYSFVLDCPVSSNLLRIRCTPRRNMPSLNLVIQVYACQFVVFWLFVLVDLAEEIATNHVFLTGR